MSKKVYVIDTEGYYIECPKVATAGDMKRARWELAIAADELRERGNQADAQTVYNAVRAAYWGLPDALTNITEFQLFEVMQYIENCVAKNNSIYWPYVQNRVLDFLECEHITKENVEV